MTIVIVSHVKKVLAYSRFLELNMLSFSDKIRIISFKKPCESKQFSARKPTKISNKNWKR